jgi:hypothetical protein
VTRYAPLMRLHPCAPMQPFRCTAQRPAKGCMTCHAVCISVQATRRARGRHAHRRRDEDGACAPLTWRVGRKLARTSDMVFC